MSAPPLPPLPPRPYDQPRTSALPPPIPPLPPNYRPQDDDYNYASGPHWEDAMVAPRPHKVDPDIPANMARTLDEQASNPYPAPYPQYGAPGPLPTPQPPAMNYNPGFVMPQQRGHSSMPPRGPSPLPPPQGTWNVWNAPATSPPTHSAYGSQDSMPYPGAPPNDSLSASMAALSFSSPPQARPHPHGRQASNSALSTYGPPAKSPSPPRQANGAPSLTASLPSIPTLTAALGAMQNPAHDPQLKIAWCRDVLHLVDRVQPNAASSTAISTDQAPGPARITDPALQRLTQVAVPLVLEIAGKQPQPSPMPRYMAEAIFLRATFANTGQFPEHVQQNPRVAFRDFEVAARNGHHPAWFRLGREYETVGDAQHAKDCFERGMNLNVESCLYRLGMAHLMGQLGFPANAEHAVPLLQRAATLSTIHVPQPAYVYGLLLLEEFSHVTVPRHLFDPFIPPGFSREGEARKHLERAAYLNFAPAQYKLGHAYEFAEPPFSFDPLLSVQYYSLASQQGETEADMALSKWFLCGAEGCFEKDETLAYTFAEKAARKGLPSAEFAMGYYAEVGVGGPKDMQAAHKWYTKASDHGNSDAKERLVALNQAVPQALSRQEHDQLTENTLVRKRTQAKQRAEARPGYVANQPPPASAQQVVNVIRQNSIQQPQDQGQRRPTYGNVQPGPRPMSDPDPASFARPNPPRAHPNAHRYTLVDPGSGSGSGSPSASPALGPRREQSPARPPVQQRPGREQSPARPPGQQRPGREQSTPMPPPQSRPPTTGPMGGAPPPGGQRPSLGPGLGPAPASQKPAGPQTFAEMGFHSQKLDDKDCVIM